MLLLITRRKAQRLATRIEEEGRKVALEAGLNAEKVKRFRGELDAFDRYDCSVTSDHGRANADVVR
ncbi:hypothetical protein QYN14_03520 [Rhodococcus ruber]|uniref:hypothetical protein n=1 Tax=Rhodococcus ruber TaxID=1830 RepID=UPI0026587317|nr:hypothetical protein [Rhodococcus ruber]WKK12690.1 hypothetical protein QYN14_03520 [Rhodococcus ruber]